MNVIQTNLAMLAKRRLVIGFEGENERTQLRIDAADLFEEYPNAYPSLVVKPLHEDAYPSIVSKDGDDVVWDITADILSFVGDGEIQLTFTSGNTIAKTVIGKIYVNRSLNPNGDPPEHLDTWLEQATGKLAEVDEAVNALDAIDAIARGLPAGSDPTVTLRYVEALGHKRFTFEIPKGDKGDKGDRGNGIRSISQSGSTGLYKKYTIHFTDGTTTTFQVRDGDRGLKGDTGATPDIGIGTVQTLPAGSEATASMSGTAEEPLLNLGIPRGETGATGERGEKGDPGSMGPAGPAGSTGPQGPKGDPGDPGRGIARVTKISTVELVDTYQITFTDGSTFPFTVHNGAAGETGETPNFAIGRVQTLPAGSNASATITGTAENPQLNLNLPRGDKGERGEKGDPGPTGATGSTGPAGPEGPAGETGAAGPQGPKGDPGEGVPTGGITGQVLAKASDTDYDTEWIHVAPVIKNEASGAIASFADGADRHPVDELKVSVEPVQDLHGYDHPWPGGGGKNQIYPPNITFKKWRLDSNVFKTVPDDSTAVIVTVDGENVTIKVATAYFGAGFFVEASSVDRVFSVSESIGGAVQFWSNYAEGATRISTGSTSCSIPANTSGFLALRIDSVSEKTAKVQLESGSTATAWSPYSNICPITGWDGVQVWDDPVHGGNIKWNQILEYGDMSTWYQSVTTDFVKDINNRAVSATMTAASSRLTRREFATKQNHVYMVSAKITVGVANNVRLEMSRGWTSKEIALSAGIETLCSVLLRPRAENDSVGGGWLQFYISNLGSYPSSMRVRDVMVLDLTEMFGEGNEPATVEEFKALFPADYYPYNAGETTTVSAVNGNPYRHYSITLPTEAGTVYGGELTVNADGSGSLVVDRKGVVYDGSNDEAWASVNSLPWRYTIDANDIKIGNATSLYVTSNLMRTTTAHWAEANYGILNNMNAIVVGYPPANNDVAAFRAFLSSNPLQVVYLLATPITYTLTSTEIRTLLGTNNVWSDAGDVSVKYNADTKLYIDNKITQAIAAALNS